MVSIVATVHLSKSPESFLFEFSCLGEGMSRWLGRQSAIIGLG